MVLVATLGLDIAFTGQWIASPTPWRGVLAGVLALVIRVSWAPAGTRAERGGSSTTIPPSAADVPVVGFWMSARASA